MADYEIEIMNLTINNDISIKRGTVDSIRHTNTKDSTWDIELAIVNNPVIDENIEKTLDRGIAQTLYRINNIQEKKNVEYTDNNYFISMKQPTNEDNLNLIKNVPFSYNFYKINNKHSTNIISLLSTLIIDSDDIILKSILNEELPLSTKISKIIEYIPHSRVGGYNTE